MYQVEGDYMNVTYTVTYTVQHEDGPEAPSPRPKLKRPWMAIVEAKQRGVWRSKSRERKW